MRKQAHRISPLTAGALLFVSGVTALVYEVLWLRELALLFGNSAQAAAATTAAFFAGLAAGNAFWGRWSAKTRQPLRVYGWLELGLACSSVLYFVVLTLYESIFGALYAQFADAPAVFLLIKFVLAFTLFFPIAFFMGGTLPMITECVVQRRDNLGSQASALYATNTIGAAIGAVLGGFVLPWFLGVRASYVLTMTISVAIAFVALWMSTRISAANPDTTSNSFVEHKTVQPGKSTAAPVSVLHSHTAMVLIASLSGFTTLALQVLWIRMFAQVLHNSVYSYATILAVFLLALAAGGVVARWVAARDYNPTHVLPIALATSALLAALSPIVFASLTNGGTYIGGQASLVGYIGEIAWLVFVCIGIPMVVIGSLLPYLFKLSEDGIYAPGETVGRLVTWNTLAGIVGSVAAGFLLLQWLGLWTSIFLMAFLYLASAVWLASQLLQKTYWPAGITAITAILLFTIADPRQLPTVRIDTERRGEKLLQVWEGSDATVAVIEQDGFLRTKLNNWYALGSTGDKLTQQIQAHLPMLLHSKPKRVFFLGLGTGITAGTALDYPVDEVTVAEIAPSVISASQTYFSDHTNGLFEDPRVTVLPEDGRTALRGLSTQFDLIISDLFVPWRAGVGSLYSTDHYFAALERLNSSGLYVQWLPLYQTTREEFSTIARSMHEVFGQVTLWRGNFWADKPVIALIGHKDRAALRDSAPLIRASRRALTGHINTDGEHVPLMSHYSGQLTATDPLIRNAEVNTDDFPLIEYRAPINHRRERAGLIRWFTDDELLKFQASRLSNKNLAEDSYLSQLQPQWRLVIQAGYYLQVQQKLKREKNEQESAARATYQNLLNRAAERLAQQL